ncbi:hypothetical protein KAR91_55165 [Candidatus Pacearchaeota archaeon]|nr:hypothetical protein [Candidatus Pacearchaeota archaeon]
MKSNKFEEGIIKLKRFNRNANKLKNSELIKWYFDNGLEIGALATERTPQTGFPPDLYLDAFLLTFRKCIQDNDNSIRIIAKVYNTLDVKKDLQVCFNDLRRAINAHLDSKPFMVFRGIDKELQDLTSNEIMHIFLYGKLVHENPKKAELYEKMTNNKFMGNFYWFEFYMTLYKCTVAIFHISLNNKAVLKELKNYRK